MAEIPLLAEPRSTFGKGAARQIRRDGRIPAVLYGHHEAPVHLTLPGHELMMALKASNVLLNIELEGKHQLALPKAVQRDPIRRIIEHVDLLLVRSGEKVTVDVPLVTTGELAPGAGLVEHTLNSLSVETEATHIPTSFEVSIEGLETGAQILAKDVPLPRGTTLATDPEHIVLHVMLAPSAEALLGEETAAAEAEKAEDAEAEEPAEA
jgi:large subunit ribosomal protein L25